jgi:hypothetical protein
LTGVVWWSSWRPTVSTLVTMLGVSLVQAASSRRQARVREIIALDRAMGGVDLHADTRGGGESFTIAGIACGRHRAR